MPAPAPPQPDDLHTTVISDTVEEGSGDSGGESETESLPPVEIALTAPLPIASHVTLPVEPPAVVTTEAGDTGVKEMDAPAHAEPLSGSCVVVPASTAFLGNWTFAATLTHVRVLLLRERCV